MTALVTVVIPTYKRPELLSRAISSVLHGTEHKVDVIVLDDDPASSGARVALGFEGIRYLAKGGLSKGLSSSRNLGIQLSESPYIIFLDDDDFLEFGAINSFISAISPGVSFYHSNFYYQYPNHKVSMSTATASTNRLLVVNMIPVGSYMIEKAALRAHFDISLKSHEDWSFLLDNVNWENSKHIDEHLVTIDKTRQDESSMQVRRRDKFWMEFVGIYCKHPAPNLSAERAQKIREFGIEIPAALLT